MGKNLGVYLYGRRKRERPKKIFSPKPRFFCPPFSSLCCCCCPGRRGGRKGREARCVPSLSFLRLSANTPRAKRNRIYRAEKKIFQPNNDDSIGGTVFAFKFEGEERSDGLNPSVNSLPPTIQYFMLTFLM